ncbi:MAG: ISL3 family transposase [Bacteroidia bacterium]|nr:ISL3 family transposase [Bacteroidia bacterium]
MDQELPIFTAALGLSSPWKIVRIEFSEAQALHIYVSHPRGSRFEFEGRLYPVYDHQERTWRHLNFFEHTCYLHAAVPRVRTHEGETCLVAVPWASGGSSFTLLFEHHAMSLVRGGMSIYRAGLALAIDGRRILGIIRNRVHYALATQPLAPVEELSVDETSRARGHDYLTILSDREAKKVVGIAPGKDQAAMSNALIDMEVRGADSEAVKTVTMDMSPSFIAGAEAHLPDAGIVFDRLHIVKQLNEALDKVRRSEQAQHKEELKKTRYLWLRNNPQLKPDQQARVATLAEAYPTLGQAYRLKELLRDILDQAAQDQSLKPLKPG